MSQLQEFNIWMWRKVGLLKAVLAEKQVTLYSLSEQMPSRGKVRREVDTDRTEEKRPWHFWHQTLHCAPFLSTAGKEVLDLRVSDSLW